MSDPTAIPSSRGRGMGFRSHGLACCVAAALLLCWPLEGHAQEEDRQWNLSPFLGVHSPRLKALNKGEFRAPLPGRGLLLVEGEAGVPFDFMIENPLPQINFGTEAGFEVGLTLDERNSVFFGASVWESGSASRVLTQIPFQGEMTPVGYERSATISYFQYFLGFQRILSSEAKKYNVYGRFALHEVFDIDYRENIVFGFEPEEAGDDPFSRIVVMEAQATGVMMLQFGLGGEYFLRDWFSLGADFGYTLSTRKFRLGDATLRSNIQPEDNLNLRTPMQIDERGRFLRYLAEASGFDDDQVT